MRAGEWLVVGGAFAVVVGGFLDWFQLDGISMTNAFDYPLTGALPWLLVVAAGALTLLGAVGLLGTRSAPWPVALTANAGVALVLVLVRVVAGSDDGPDGAALDRAGGLWLSLLGTAAAAVGTALGARAARPQVDEDQLRRMRDAFDDR